MAGDGVDDVVAGVVVGVALPWSLLVGVPVLVLVLVVEVEVPVPGAVVGVGDVVGAGDGVAGEVAGLADDALPVGVGVDVVGLEGLLGEDVEGGGVGEDVEVTLSVSHCQTVGLEFTLPETTPVPLGDEARLCGAMAAVTTNPAAVVSKTLPALRPIADGRTRAKHM